MTPHGDPATDPPMTVRVHPDDDPHDPAARRAVKTDEGDSVPWFLVTGNNRVDRCRTWHSDRQVADWPVTHPIVWGAVFRHAIHAGHGQPAETPASLTPDESARLFRAGYADHGK